eukprot:TRINITY_DN9186_c0_g1_i1.p1 TRINITY_DN9186_c0_g1~~TRINITY_DN9186_c0_g1_i1.p1  ORF type:complete len:178 (-),score=16.64 TRINITY_DN9186_c0_g1_i1:178-711(-)
MDKKRLFLALEVPKDIQDIIYSHLKEVPPAESVDSNINWQKDIQMHLSLHFLGDESVSKVVKLLNQNKSLLGNRFTVTLSKFSYDGTRTLRVMTKSKQLSALSRSIKFMTGSAVTSYSGHITLARLKNVSPDWINQYMNVVGSIDLSTVSWEVKSFFLYSSNKSEYTKESEFNLSEH